MTTNDESLPSAPESRLNDTRVVPEPGMTNLQLAELLAEHTHTFKCGACGRNWITAKSDGPWLLVHTCPELRRADTGRPRPRPRLRLSQLAHREEERREWAERQLGSSPITEALEAELGDRAYLDGGGEE